MSTVRRHVLMLPVSGPNGAGEYYRCVTIAQSCLRQNPGWRITIAVNRYAQLEHFDGISYWDLEDSPTKDDQGVLQAINQLKPDLVLFDSTLRQPQLKQAKKIGAQTVYISSRLSKRRKGFGVLKLPLLDEHWIIAPPDQHFLSLREKVVSNCFQHLKVVYLTTLAPSPDPQRRISFLKENHFHCDDYVLFVSGGGGGYINNQPTAAVFQRAARTFHAEAQRATVFVAGPLSQQHIHTEKNRLELHSVSPELLSDLIDGASLVVSGGGSIVHQTLALQRPCLAIPAGGSDQPERINRLSSAGVLATCDADCTSLAKAAHELSSNRYGREKLAKLSTQKGYTNGLETVNAELKALLSNESR